LVALVSFWFIPNFPDSTGTYFITEEEAAMAQYRQTVSAGGIAEDDAGGYWDGFWMCMKEPFAHLFAAIHFFLIIAQSYKDFFPSVSDPCPLLSHSLTMMRRLWLPSDSLVLPPTSSRHLLLSSLSL
jgi:hypothetical protein